MEGRHDRDLAPDDMTNDLVRRYAEAGARDDFDAMDALRHPDWQEAWPQSGEIVITNADYRAARTQRPEGAPRVEPGRIGGSSDCWWSESVVHYADGSRWLAVTIYELRDELIWRERIYFGPPVTAPAWRAQWVKREAPAIT